MVVENKALLERIVIMAGACHCAKNCNEILEAALKKGRLADGFVQQVRKVFEPVKAVGGCDWTAEEENEEEVNSNKEDDGEGQGYGDDDDDDDGKDKDDGEKGLDGEVKGKKDKEDGEDKKEDVDGEDMEGKGDEKHGKDKEDGKKRDDGEGGGDEDDDGKEMEVKGKGKVEPEKEDEARGQGDDKKQEKGAQKDDEEEEQYDVWHEMPGTSPNVLALFMDQLAVPEQFLSSPHTNYRPLRLDRLWFGKGKKDMGIIESLMGLTGNELSITGLEYNVWTYTVVESRRKPLGDPKLGFKGEVAVPEAVLAHQKVNGALTEHNSTLYIRHTKLEEMVALVDLLMAKKVRRMEIAVLEMLVTS
jgi:hypothetical protein